MNYTVRSSLKGDLEKAHSRVLFLELADEELGEVDETGHCHQSESPGPNRVYSPLVANMTSMSSSAMSSCQPLPLHSSPWVIRLTSNLLPSPDHTGVVDKTDCQPRNVWGTHISTVKPSSLEVILLRSSRFCISASTVTTLPSLCPNSLYAASHFAFTSAKLLARLASMTTFDPALAKRTAVEAPMPDEAPVIRAIGISSM
jgi:hypothetical protein